MVAVTLTHIRNIGGGLRCDDHLPVASAREPAHEFRLFVLRTLSVPFFNVIPGINHVAIAERAQ